MLGSHPGHFSPAKEFDAPDENTGWVVHAVSIVIKMKACPAYGVNAAILQMGHYTVELAVQYCRQDNTLLS